MSDVKKSSEWTGLPGEGTEVRQDKAVKELAEELTQMTATNNLQTSLELMRMKARQGEVVARLSSDEVMLAEVATALAKLKIDVWNYYHNKESSYTEVRWQNAQGRIFHVNMERPKREAEVSAVNTYYAYPKEEK